MERTEPSAVIYLDTHIVCWLYEGRTDKFSQAELTVLNEGQLFVSPIVVLELQYLYEVGKILEQSDTILSALRDEVGLHVSVTPFALVARTACTLSWTRDPFDRLLVAEVLLNPNARLLSRDRMIRAHCGQIVE